MTKAELLDKDKNPVDMLEQGEKLYVKVTYEVKDDTIKNPVLELRYEQSTIFMYADLILY